MNVAQVNQHQKSQFSKEAKPAEVDSSLLHAFKGQLQFAENDLKLMSPQITKGDDLREQHEEIEKKREDEDFEKSVELSYLNDQNLQNRYEDSLKTKTLGQDLQNDAAKEKANVQAQTVENAINQKKLNQKIGKERIIEQKPHVISSGIQEEGAEMPKNEFAELIKAKQNSQVKLTTQAFNAAPKDELPIEAEPFANLANQTQKGLNRDSLLSKSSLEKNDGVKPQTVQAGSQKSSSSVDYKATKSDNTIAGKDGSKHAAKADSFINELNASVKENQKSESAAPAKQAAVKESEQQNQNVKDVTNNIKIMLSSGRDTIVLRLNPEHLGKLEIKLKKSGEGLTGEFKVENAEAKKLLSNEFAQLKQDLENQGIKLDQFSVFIKGEENNSYSQNSSQGQAQQDFSSEQQASQSRVVRQEIDPIVHQAVQRANPETGVRIVV